MDKKPMSLDELLTEKREKILAVAAKYGASNLRIFGSVARGEAREDSDIDFGVEIEPNRSLLDRIVLMQELKDLLIRKVDVVKPGNVHQQIYEPILREVVTLGETP